MGQICAACRQDIDRRAARVARWVSLVTTLLFGAYVMVRLPTEQAARMVGGASVVMWYLVSRMIALRVSRAWLER